MSRIATFSCMIIAILATAHLQAQTICTWRHNASAAVSFTFDDGIADQITIGATALERNGWFGTFYLVSGSTADYTPYRALAAKGHEIGAHATTHQDYSTLDTNAIRTDITGCNAKIESEINRKVLTFAYPYCSPGSSKPIVSRYYIAARICNTNINSGSSVWPESNRPYNMWAIGSATTDGFIADSANKAVSRTMRSTGWLVELFHGLTSLQTGFQKHVDFLVTKQDSLFIAPFGDVARYINERIAGKIATISKTSTAWTLSLTDSLDNTIYERPVTLKVTLPAEWSSVSVTQAGTAVWSRQTGTTLLLDAVPDKGDINITATGTGTVHGRSCAPIHRSNRPVQTYAISGARIRPASSNAARLSFVSNEKTGTAGSWRRIIGEIGY